MTSHEISHVAKCACALQCIQDQKPHMAQRVRCQDNLLKFKQRQRMRKKGDLSDLEHTYMPVYFRREGERNSNNRSFQARCAEGHL